MHLGLHGGRVAIDTSPTGAANRGSVGALPGCGAASPTKGRAMVLLGLLMLVHYGRYSL